MLYLVHVATYNLSNIEKRKINYVMYVKYSLLFNGIVQWRKYIKNNEI
jgi:hypothetical protein